MRWPRLGAPSWQPHNLIGAVSGAFISVSSLRGVRPRPHSASSGTAGRDETTRAPGKTHRPSAWEAGAHLDGAGAGAALSPGLLARIGGLQGAVAVRLEGRSPLTAAGVLFLLIPQFPAPPTNPATSSHLLHESQHHHRRPGWPSPALHPTGAQGLREGAGTLGPRGQVWLRSPCSRGLKNWGPRQELSPKARLARDPHCHMSLLPGPAGQQQRWARPGPMGRSGHPGGAPCLPPLRLDKLMFTNGLGQQDWA